MTSDGKVDEEPAAEVGSLGAVFAHRRLRSPQYFPGPVFSRPGILGIGSSGAVRIDAIRKVGNVIGSPIRTGGTYRYFEGVDLRCLTGCNLTLGEWG